MSALDELLGREVSMRGLRWLRVLAGPIVVLHLWPFLADSLHGRTYADAFNQPYVSWYPQLPEGLYIALLWLAVVAAVAMTLGMLPRVATAVAFAVVTYNLFLTTTNFHNNRAYLVIVLGLLALAPTDRRSGPAWPLWLLRFECAAVYAASGTSKLLDHDWRSGTVSWLRVVQDRHDLVAAHVPHWAIAVITDRDVHAVAAKVIIATELFIAAGLWSRRTRWLAVAVGVAFHLVIQISAPVQVFSLLGIAVLVCAWCVPSRV